MAAALRTDEGLLARLSPSDAACEVASLVATAWAIASSGGSATNPAQRPDGVPAPMEVLQASVGAIARRLTAEAGAAARERRPSDSSDTSNEDGGSAEKNASTVARAMQRANLLKESALAPLRSQIRALR